MTITKADPNSPFWTACRENTERHERRVTAEQELANLKFDLRELLIAWRGAYPDVEPYDEYKQGAQAALSDCAEDLERLLGGAQ